MKANPIVTPAATPPATGESVSVAIGVGIGGLAIGIGIDPFCWSDPCWSSCWDPCSSWWGSCWNDCWWGSWCGSYWNSWCGWGWGSWCGWGWNSWCGWGWPYWNSWCSYRPWWDCGWSWCWNSWYTPSWYDSGPVYVATNWYAEGPAPARVHRPLTNAELGDSYLRAGDAGAAIAAYRLHLDVFPSDMLVMRSLGLALLYEGRADEAAETIDSAYRAEPGLASSRVDPALFPSPDEFRINLELATAYANRVKTGAAWLTVAVLLQGDGNMVQAEMMLDRAVAAGLEQEISVPLRQALRG